MSILRPRRLWFALIAGIVFIGAGVAYHHLWASRIDERVTTGRAVTATVLEYRLGMTLPDSLVVRYTVDSRTYEASLAALGPSDPYAVNDVVTVFVDPSDPTTAATRDGYLSESRWLMLLPLLFVSIGLVFVFVTVIQLLRRWPANWTESDELDPKAKDETLSVRMILTEGAEDTWSLPYDRLHSQISARSGLLKPNLRLRVTFVADRTEVKGEKARVESYSRRHRLLAVRVAVPASPSHDGDQKLLVALRAAVVKAEGYAIERGLASGLPEVNRLLEQLPPSQLRSADPSSPPRPFRADRSTFDVVRRGYCVRDVDAFLRWLQRAAASNSPDERKRAQIALRLTSFPRMPRGYDPQQVDDHLKILIHDLRQKDH